MADALASPSAYEVFIYALPDRYPAIGRSTLVYVATGDLFGRAEGRIFFANDIVLCVQEFLNFELNVIEGYGYEVSRALVELEGEDAPPAKVLPSFVSEQREALLVRFLSSPKRPLTGQH